MPANLPPQYFEAEKHFRIARSPEEKIEALEAMLAIMPKHKGTDKLHADLRRKIAKISEEAERKYATSRKSFYIRKEGAGQVALVGLPNVGKSQLLAAVTEASPEIADYPFTTKAPTIGMMKFENIQIQLVDTPPITSRNSHIWLNNIARNADTIAIIVDLSNQPTEQVETTLQELENMGIMPAANNTQETTIGKHQRKMLIIGNKNDSENSTANWSELNSQYNAQFPMIAISAEEGDNLEELKREIFEALDIIRVHTKTPGTKPDLTDPVILKRGSTVKDAAESVHKDFRSKFKYALVWGSGKFDGQRVSPEHIIQDGDIIEFHI
ncbi:MAG TPA: TGS domain-containing protein [Dehalococcoidia bacterium]|nr:TGS domain-containing protein [Dehalococcoidia bacterium]